MRSSHYIKGEKKGEGKKSGRVVESVSCSSYPTSGSSQRRQWTWGKNQGSDPWGRAVAKTVTEKKNQLREGQSTPGQVATKRRIAPARTNSFNKKREDIHGRPHKKPVTTGVRSRVKDPKQKRETRTNTNVKQRKKSRTGPLYCSIAIGKHQEELSSKTEPEPGLF